MSDVGPRSSRGHSRRVALDLPLELVWHGACHPIRAVLVNDEGALVLSSVSYPLRERVQVRNPQTGAEALCRVEWCRGDAAQTGPRYRLALRIIGGTSGPWGPVSSEGRGP